MKTFVNLIVITAFIASCSSEKQSKDDLAYIDVRKNYPEKEIFLTDIADVTYLYLNSDDDDYLYRGRINYIAPNTVVVYDWSSGSILFFSRDGTPKSRFNRRGQGPGEYGSGIWDMIYDEAADELFVNDWNALRVYSSMGEYKRTIARPQGTEPLYIIDFDAHSLFFFDYSIENKRNYALFTMEHLPTDDYFLPFYRISKTDGEVLDYVELPGTNLLLGAYYKGTYFGVTYNGMWRQAQLRFAMKCPEGVLLCNHQTDTIFLYRGDKSLTPVLCKTPSATSLNPVEYLNNSLDRGLYQFIQVNIMREDVFPLFYPAKYYMRNKKTGEIVRTKFLLPDYKGKEFIMDPMRPNTEGSVAADGIIYDDGYCFELSLFELKQAYRENKLSGKLKELVATLNEDEDNNVFMLVKFK